jgi:hypothetical protein
MALHTAVVYGSARRGSEDIKAARFSDEYNWHANTLKAARMSAACNPATPVRQGLCRGDQ